MSKAVIVATTSVTQRHHEVEAIHDRCADATVRRNRRGLVQLPVGRDVVERTPQAAGASETRSILASQNAPVRATKPANCGRSDSCKGAAYSRRSMTVETARNGTSDRREIGCGPPIFADSSAPSCVPEPGFRGRRHFAREAHRPTTDGDGPQVRRLIEAPLTRGASARSRRWCLLPHVPRMR